MLRFLLALNIVWSFICVLMYLVIGANPSTFWMFSVINLILPIVFLVNLLIVLFWLVFKWRNCWLPLITLLLGWKAFFLMFSFGENSTANKCLKDPVSIMSYNVYGLKQLRDTARSISEMKKAKFISFIRQHDPDILCVQEDNFFADEIINNSGIYPYFHYMIQHGAAIYSRFPIMDKGRIEFGTKTNSCLWVDVLVQGKAIRVYSLHLQSNQLASDISSIKQNDKTSESSIATVKNMLRKYKKNTIVRSQQARLVTEDALKSGKPCILAGDFNDTPFSHCYKLLTKEWNDSFLTCGSGLGTTFAGAIPGLRIDYVLGDQKKIVFCSHKVFQTSYSDHHPLFVKFYVKN